MELVIRSEEQMPCIHCEERAKSLVEVRAAYHRGDIPEVKRLFKEMYGSILKDVENLTSMVFKTPEGGVERFDLTPKKPESKP